VSGAVTRLLCFAYLVAGAACASAPPSESPDDPAPPNGTPPSGAAGGGGQSSQAPTTAGDSNAHDASAPPVGASATTDTGNADARSTIVDSGEPAPPPTWVNATGNLAGMGSDCTNLYRVATHPASGRVIAGVALHGLFASDDGGKSWQPLGTGAGSAQIINRVSSITFDPEHPDVFWETGTHTGAGFYKTTDAGLTFRQLGTMTFSQDAAVDFGDPERKTLLTGTHGRGVFRSTDGGATFVDISAPLPGNTLWPLLLDAKTYLVGTFDSDASGPNVGIYRTSDAGTTFTKVSQLAPSHDGGFFRAKDGSIYLALAGNGGIAKSQDLGKTWTIVNSSAKSYPPPFFRITPIELPDGKLVTLGVDHLLRSADGGATFQPIGDPLPFALRGSDFGGMTYSATTKTFFVWHSDCGTAVLPDAIMSAGFDWAKR
jgi:hypothetical protein